MICFAAGLEWTDCKTARARDAEIGNLLVSGTANLNGHAGGCNLTVSL